MKVLFASDGSKYSNHAARYLTKTLHAKAKHLDVTLFYVDPPMLKRVNEALGAKRVAQIHAENAAVNLKGDRQFLRRAGVSFDESHAIGNAAQSIARKAEKENYDLVLMGSRGRSALQNVLLGSVTARVLSSCKVPVLVVS